MTRRRILCKILMLVLIAATVFVMEMGMGRRCGGCVGLHIFGADDCKDSWVSAPCVLSSHKDRGGYVE